MHSDRSLIEREMQRLELQPFTLEGFHRSRERKQRNKRIRAGTVALLVTVLGTGALLRALPSGVMPADDTRSPFLGSWVATDTDGSTQTMTVETPGDDAVEVAAHDDSASVCSNTPSTMVGIGRLEGTSQLVIPSPMLTCDDGSQPEGALSDPPLQDQLRDLTFVHDPEDDVLTDSLGVVWGREGAEDPTPDLTASGGMWPQSSLEEVRQAQERADVGDPDYAWQVDANLASYADGVGESPLGAEIFERFVRQQIGWEEFSNFAIRGYVEGGGQVGAVLYIRCAPGRTNPLYPKPYPEMPAALRGCAPTIDDSRYETVRFHVEQPARIGPSGIWVVTGWKIDRGQVEQVAPPSNAEVTAFLGAFLGARMDGEGAEQYLRPREGEGPPSPDEVVPLLYATTGGSPYERSEIERVQGPEWPTGWIEFEVRLFAEDGTVVEQSFVVVRQDDRLGLVYGSRAGWSRMSTTEDGQAVPVPYSFLDGEVTFAAAPPWGDTRLEQTFTILGGVGRGSASQFTMFAVVADPLTATGCEAGPPAADAEALVRSIRSKPDFEVTAPLAVSVGGNDALRMDVVAAAPERLEVGDCVPSVLEHLWLHDDRMRLYLLDLPAGMSARTLAIAIVAQDSEFERVVNAAGPVLDSFEFHTR